MTGATKSNALSTQNFCGFKRERDLGYKVSVSRASSIVNHAHLMKSFRSVPRPSPPSPPSPLHTSSSSAITRFPSPPLPPSSSSSHPFLSSRADTRYTRVRGKLSHFCLTHIMMSFIRVMSQIKFHLISFPSLN